MEKWAIRMLIFYFIISIFVVTSVFLDDSQNT